MGPVFFSSSLNKDHNLLQVSSEDSEFHADHPVNQHPELQLHLL